MKDTSISYQSVTVHIDRINIVNQFESQRSSKHQVQSSSEEDSIQAPVVKKDIKFNTDGTMSAQTRRKLQKAIKYLNYMTIPQTVHNRVTGKDVNMRLSFATLTLSSAQIHSDNDIKNKLINQLLVEVKHNHKVSRYVWRSEKQSNGNVHFHILFDKFVPCDWLRSTWNRIQNKLGYVDRYSVKMSKLTYKEYEKTWKQNKNFNEAQCRSAYRKGKQQGWKHPNSTDIHSLMFVNNIDSYLFKYLTKSEQNENLEGRMWGCSRDLSDLKGGRDIIDSELNQEILRLKESGKVRYIVDDFFTIMFIDIDMLVEYNCMRLYNLLRDYLFEHFAIPKEYY